MRRFSADRNSQVHFNNLVDFYHRLCGQLSDLQRNVLIMRYSQHLPNSEVAKRLGISQLDACELHCNAINQIVDLAEHWDGGEAS